VSAGSGYAVSVGLQAARRQSGSQPARLGLVLRVLEKQRQKRALDWGVKRAQA
jgi:hypothetical protein